MKARIAMALYALVGTACTISDATFTGIGGDANHDGVTSSTTDAPPVAGLACNQPVALGSISDIVPSGTVQRYLAAARTSTGLVVGYTTSDGITAVTIDLTAPTPVRSAEAVVSPITTDSGLQVVSSADRITFSTDVDGIDDAGTRLTETDTSLGPISSRIETAVNPAAPDDTAATAGGGIVLVGRAQDLEQAAILDSADNLVSMTSYALVGGTGGSITSLPDGRFAGTWYTDGTPTCDLRIMSNTLVSIDHTSLSACTAARVAPSPDGTRIAVAYGTGNGVSIAMYSDALVPSTVIPLLASTITTPRMATGADAFWTLAPATVSDLEIISTDFATNTATRHALAPFFSTTGAGHITFDVVGDGQHVWAVWASQYASPTLYVEQMCL